MLPILCFGGYTNENTDGKCIHCDIPSPTTNVASKPDKQMLGSITGITTLMNIHLVEPTITMNHSNAALKGTCRIGTICRLMNQELSDETKKENHHRQSPP